MSNIERAKEAARQLDKRLSQLSAETNSYTLEGTDVIWRDVITSALAAHARNEIKLFADKMIELVEDYGFGRGYGIMAGAFDEKYDVDPDTDIDVIIRKMVEQYKETT